MPMKFCGNSGFASLQTHCVWFDGLSQHISFIVLWLCLLTCFYLCTGMHTFSAKKLAGSQVNGKNYVEYTPFRLPKWISEFKCTFSYCIELHWSTLTIFLYGIPFPKIHVSEPLKLLIQKKWGDLVNETVKGSFFIIEQTEIMIGLLF